MAAGEFNTAVLEFLLADEPTGCGLNHYKNIEDHLGNTPLDDAMSNHRGILRHHSRKQDSHWQASTAQQQTITLLRDSWQCTMGDIKGLFALMDLVPRLICSEPEPASGQKLRT